MCHRYEAKIDFFYLSGIVGIKWLQAAADN